MSRIFIVDDDATIVQMLSDILADEGYDVLGCVQSLRAIDLAKGFAPDLIVLNKGMPYRDGFEVAALLRHDVTFRQVPIILTTACAALRYEGWTGDALDALGIVSCLYKPFEVTALFEQIEGALENWQWAGHTPGMPGDSVPAVFTLAFLGEVPPRLALLVPGLMVFRRQSDGRLTVDGFPDATDVCDAVVAQLDPRVVRMERGKLFISVANGEAVYVPVGESALRGCRQYGRLYLRLADGVERAPNLNRTSTDAQPPVHCGERP